MSRILDHLLDGQLAGIEVSNERQDGQEVVRADLEAKNYALPNLR